MTFQHLWQTLLNTPHLVTVLGALILVGALASIVHVLLTKRKSNSALTWMALIVLSPLPGQIFYYLFGINRIRRAATLLKEKQGLGTPLLKRLPNTRHTKTSRDLLAASAWIEGNSVEVLSSDFTYPEMLKAIDRAQHSIGLSTYIFDWDRAGKLFAERLLEAQKRGVHVRILVDGVGALYHLPTSVSQMKKMGLKAQKFLPPFKFWTFSFINLRLHRKILTIDGQVAFCGGMNIREGHWPKLSPKKPIKDQHFKIKGPIVNPIQEAFAQDWYFSTKESLRGERWFPELSHGGSCPAMPLPDGPDEDFERIRWHLIRTISEAQHSLAIRTPYFLPDSGIITALNAASLRGVKVQILLPQENNLPWMSWATMGLLPQLLSFGCEVYTSPPPFDHSKIFVIDEGFVHFGSSNWDARSLRLNFELDLMFKSTDLAKMIHSTFQKDLKTSTRILEEDLSIMSTRIQLRNQFFRLFTPIL